MKKIKKVFMILAAVSVALMLPVHAMAAEVWHRLQQLQRRSQLRHLIRKIQKVPKQKQQQIRLLQKQRRVQPAKKAAKQKECRYFERSFWESWQL